MLGRFTVTLWDRASAGSGIVDIAAIREKAWLLKYPQIAQRLGIPFIFTGLWAISDQEFFMGILL
jgi:Na+-transporting NADH:ubiquinone oxidoreductase subunit NqrE